MKPLVILLLLAGCNIAQQSPGAIECRGKATLSATGALSMFGGGNGMVTFDCGKGGAFIRQGANVNGMPEPVVVPPEPPVPDPVPAPSPVVPPHRPPIPPVALHPQGIGVGATPRMLIPYIHTEPQAACIPGWTATAWTEEPLTRHCR